MTLIYITSTAGELIGPVVLPAVPGLGVQLPAGAVQFDQALPAHAQGKAWVMGQSGPVQVEDHRGTVYNTETGAAQQHTALGSLPAGLTHVARPSTDHSWQSNKWQLDPTLQAANANALRRELCAQIDTAADAVRLAVAGDPLRALEYDRAASEAQAFAAANYQGDVPPMVAAWAINGRTAQQATDSILAEAAQYNAALVQLRTVRLAAKEQVRAAMDAGNTEQAQTIAEQTIAAIQAAVAGIGNNSEA